MGCLDEINRLDPAKVYLREARSEVDRTREKAGVAIMFSVL